MNGFASFEARSLSDRAPQDEDVGVFQKRMHCLLYLSSQPTHLILRCSPHSRRASKDALSLVEVSLA